MDIVLDSCDVGGMKSESDVSVSTGAAVAVTHDRSLLAGLRGLT